MFATRKQNGDRRTWRPPGGATKARKEFRFWPKLVELERRTVPSIVPYANLGYDGTLYVEGTEAAESIHVVQYGTWVGARANDTWLNWSPAAQVARIWVNARGGNDVVYLASEYLTSQYLFIPAVVYGGTGNDALYGGAGNDTLSGESGADFVWGNHGNDLLWESGDSSGNSLMGFEGDDTVVGGFGSDRIDGGAGNDSLLKMYGAGSNVISGGTGNDYILGGTGSDYITGGAGNDRIEDYTGINSLWGDADNDVVFGACASGQYNVLYGGDGNDYLNGGFSSGTIGVFGGNGNDVIYGGTVADKLYGEGGDDVLFGLGGNDMLYGGAGTDYLDGGAGTNDWLEAGGLGAEVAVNGWNAHNPAVHGVDYTDVKQGSAETCCFLSALAAADVKYNAGYTGYNLASRLAYLGNNEYRVSLYNQDTSGWTTRDVTWTGSTVYGDPTPETEGDYWTVLFHRAYLIYIGVNPYSEASVKGFHGEGLERPLAAASGYHAIFGGDPNDTTAATMKDLLRWNALTTNTEVYPYDGRLVGRHAYTVLDIYQDTGTWYIRLYNPWGRDGPVVMGADDGVIWVSWLVYTSDFTGWAYA